MVVLFVLAVKDFLGSRLFARLAIAVLVQARLLWWLFQRQGKVLLCFPKEKQFLRKQREFGGSNLIFFFSA